MIPQIKEIEGKFPEYATLSTATATLVDMGERTISAQVKIDGSIVPDFSYDWEIEFRGERYIQPLRQPQASKGNESMRSVIDLTFHHWATWELRRYFFTQIEVLDSGTLMPNNYVYPIAYTLSDFVVALSRNLAYYYGDKIKVELNATPSTPYLEDKVEWSFSYTSIWDAVKQINEKYDVRWVWHYDSDSEAYIIKIGYDASDISHVFAYGYKEGLTKIERQSQDAEIRNQMFGRGGSQNLPYRYFKKFDPNNPSWKADPDWIPELENIHFSELRGKSFRDYVRGWKAKHYGGQSDPPYPDAYWKGYTDEQFNPVEYVEDKDSIKKYGIIRGGLDNNEEIYPTIQKRDLGNGLGRADEVVDVETILVDEPASNGKAIADIELINDSDAIRFDNPSNYKTIRLSARTADILVPKDARIVKDIDISIVQYVRVTRYSQQYDSLAGWVDIGNRVETNEENILKIDRLDISVINSATGSPIGDIANIPQGTKIYISASATASGLMTDYTENVSDSTFLFRNIQEVDDSSRIVTTFKTEIDYTPFNGQVLGNYTEGVNRISESVEIAAGKNGHVILETKEFEVGENGATSVDVPTRIISTDTTGSYSERKTINAVNTSTDEVLDPSNLTQGKYKLRVRVDIDNNSTDKQTYKVELLPAYIYYPYDASSWRPTFDIWIKNIWKTTRLVDENGVVENDTSYAERVWRPILGDKEKNNPKVVFSSGSLSGYSDWEFPIVAYAFDDSKSLDGVPSHWRLTLAKSDAEVDASGKWLPSTQTQASVGDHFYFIGIDMPHQYVLWAEEEVDKWKRENMPSEIKPTWSVILDKARINTLEDGEINTLLSQIEVGAKMRFTDKRFAQDEENRYIQSITTTWNEGNIVPDVEIVLSDKPISTKTFTDDIDETINAIASNAHRVNSEISIIGAKSKDIRRVLITHSRELDANKASIDKVFTGLTLQGTRIEKVEKDTADNKKDIDDLFNESGYQSVSGYQSEYEQLAAEYASYVAQYPVGAVMFKELADYTLAWSKYEPELVSIINSGVKRPEPSEAFKAARDAFYAARASLTAYLAKQSKANAEAIDKVASRRAEYINERERVIAEMQSEDDEFVATKAKFLQLADSEGKVLVDSEGKVLVVRAADTAYDAYRAAGVQYIIELNTIIATSGDVAESAALGLARTTYYRRLGILNGEIAVVRAEYYKVSNELKVEVQGDGADNIGLKDRMKEAENGLTSQGERISLAENTVDDLVGLTNGLKVEVWGVTGKEGLTDRIAAAEGDLTSQGERISLAEARAKTERRTSVLTANKAWSGCRKPESIVYEREIIEAEQTDIYNAYPAQTSTYISYYTSFNLYRGALLVLENSDGDVCPSSDFFDKQDAFYSARAAVLLEMLAREEEATTAIESE